MWGSLSVSNRWHRLRSKAMPERSGQAARYTQIWQLSLLDQSSKPKAKCADCAQYIGEAAVHLHRSGDLHSLAASFASTKQKAKALMRTEWEGRVCTSDRVEFQLSPALPTTEETYLAVLPLSLDRHTDRRTRHLPLCCCMCNHQHRSSCFHAPSSPVHRQCSWNRVQNRRRSDELVPVRANLQQRMSSDDPRHQSPRHHRNATYLPAAPPCLSSSGLRRADMGPWSTPYLLVPASASAPRARLVATTCFCSVPMALVLGMVAKTLDWWIHAVV
ncbi:hypothetical protein BDY17DRAFT_201477 [Neohortaea acidophila]|uniref:Uncharacterized protein n=1 Tax=Neohortaea acidophila TaxID=245834 RepID=A0A6A6PLB0_9PEZI|nr:uncharacterized protein BDY17DRAFT_201477 [Neohortaea acidophila]KAF2480860.1 hypothetical protein BDY17DRAFT_201477 [Neohortaea acidophila]